jgi:hypothetical protein
MPTTTKIWWALPYVLFYVLFQKQLVILYPWRTPECLQKNNLKYNQNQSAINFAFLLEKDVDAEYLAAKQKYEY